MKFPVCFDLEITKRWGRWIPTTFRNYLWRNEHILSNISRWTPNDARQVGRAGGTRSRHTAQAEGAMRQRLVEISRTMSGALRHRRLVGMDKEGWSLSVHCETSTPGGTTRHDERYTRNSQWRMR